MIVISFFTYDEPQILIAKKELQKPRATIFKEN